MGRRLSIFSEREGAKNFVHRKEGGGIVEFFPPPPTVGELANREIGFVLTKKEGTSPRNCYLEGRRGGEVKKI